MQKRTTGLYIDYVQLSNPLERRVASEQRYRPSVLFDSGSDGFGQIFPGAGRYDAGCLGRVG